MYKITLAASADRIILDKLTNQVSIIDVCEGFKFQSFPVVIPSLSAIFYLQREEDDPDSTELTLRCEVGDTETLSTALRADFEQGLATKTIVNFEGFLFPKPGVLRIIALSDGKELASVDLPVDQLDLPPPPTVKVEQSAESGA
jgi:hypothetical protein